jgi:hypothetical protein
MRASVGPREETAMGTSVETNLDRYIAATSEQIRRWSNGPVKRRLRPFERRDEWTHTRGTLWDERIFGPQIDYRCACGRCDGEAYSGAICPICSVKVMWREARRFRFGHINLAVKIPHPFFAAAEPLDAIPVAPAHYWENPKEPALAEAYQEILRLALLEVPPDEVVGALGTVLVHLEHHYEQVPAWDPYRAECIARAMLLAPDPDYVDPQAAQAQAQAEALPDDIDWDNLRFAD